MNIIRIIKEPSDETYKSLLKFAASRCDSFSLVWGVKVEFLPSADEVLKALEPYLVEGVKSSKWPGTELMGDKAIVRYFRVMDQSLNELSKPGRLYGWRQPFLSG